MCKKKQYKFSLYTLLFISIVMTSMLFCANHAQAATTSITLDNALTTYSDTNYEYNDTTKVLTIKTNTNDYDITGDGTVFNGSIDVLNTAKTVSITLNNLNLKPTAAQAAISFSPGVVATYTLKVGTGAVSLAGGVNHAAIYVSGMAGSPAFVTIIDAGGGGALTCTGGKGAAAIGGNFSTNEYNGGEVIIQNVNLAAKGGANGGAAIGGATGGHCGNVTITGSTVDAKGNNAAAIGGGENGGSLNGTVIIDSSTVTATGDANAAGIGGGYRGNGGTVIIRNGADVTATGGDFAAGIGGGRAFSGTGGSAGAVTIEGGTALAPTKVMATGGYGGGAGIGGGYEGNAGTVTIKDFSEVKATGGDGAHTGGFTAVTSGGGAGIGGGHAGDAGTVTISDASVVTATGGKQATGTTTATGAGSGIGGGYKGKGNSVTISGTASLTATAKDGGAGIGSGKDGLAPIGAGTFSGQKLSRTKENTGLDLPFAGEYGITYDSNIANYAGVSGTANMTNQYYYLGGPFTATIASPGTLAVSGYTFSKWTTIPNGTGTTYMPTDTIPIASPGITLYAQFIPTGTAPSATPTVISMQSGTSKIIAADLGSGGAQATSATITTSNASIVSASPTTLAASGDITVTGISVGTANITLQWVGGPYAGNTIVIPVTVTASSSGSGSNSTDSGNSGESNDVSNLYLSQLPNNANAYTAICPAPYSSLLAVSVDGSKLYIDADYSAWEGSTYVKLLPAFISSKAAGQHTITLHYAHGDATGQFSIANVNEGAIFPGLGVTTMTPPGQIKAQNVEEKASEIVVR